MVATDCALRDPQIESGLLLWILLAPGMLHNFAGSSHIVRLSHRLREYENMLCCLQFFRRKWDRKYFDQMRRTYHFFRLQWFYMNHVRNLGSPYPDILWIYFTRQMERGFIRKPCDAEYSRRIVKEVLKPLAVANSFLLVWFQQVSLSYFVCPTLCFLGGSLTRGVRVTRFMGKSSPRFSGRCI